MLSRVADNLYWNSRYIERAEHTSRLIAVKLESMIEESPREAELSWRRVVTALSGEKFAPSAAADAFEITHALAFDPFNPSSLISSLRLARDNARQVREQISTEMWNRLNRLYLKLAPVDLATVWNDQPSLIFRETVEELHMLEGTTYSTMRHGEGWHFLQLGRYIERAQLVSRLLDLHFGPASRGDAAPTYLDWLVLLRFCTGFEAYCKVYTATIRRDHIAEFLLFDADFPHSVRFAIERMTEALSHVAIGAPTARRAACERLAGRLKAGMDFGQISELMGGGIDVFLANIVAQCEQIHEAIFSAYIAYDAETVL
ncbi:MAG TPA: alpha-E domain-containing protein [Micropepsaceae bacterium]|jgi:uncharacterized alpha-E superfamily protein|nr:alpha-E domain-containing protein [Micropepsaceae bacterium]